jgi:hypothetical protein
MSQLRAWIAIARDSVVGSASLSTMRMLTPRRASSLPYGQTGS